MNETRAINRLIASNNRLWIAVICLSCLLGKAYTRLNELGGRLSTQETITRRIKQPLTVNVYPEVVQHYSGLPNFEKIKEHK